MEKISDVPMVISNNLPRNTENAASGSKRELSVTPIMSRNGSRGLLEENYHMDDEEDDEVTSMLRGIVPIKGSVSKEGFDELVKLYNGMLYDKEILENRCAELQERCERAEKQPAVVEATMSPIIHSSTANVIGGDYMLIMECMKQLLEKSEERAMKSEERLVKAAEVQLEYQKTLTGLAERIATHWKQGCKC